MYKSTRMLREMRRAIVGSLVLLLVLVMATPTRAVVFTNAGPITANDATAICSGNPYPSSIAVSGLTGTVTNVTVTLFTINHTFPDDFDMLLVGPAGGNLIILSDTGGSDDVVNRTIVLDDAAAATIPDATTLNSGTFKPTNIGAGDTFNAPAPAPSANTTFSAAFNGSDPNGAWNLFVADDLGADMGSVGNGWSLTVTTTGSSATTFTNGVAVNGGDGAKGRATPYASTITASGLTGQITDVNVTLTNMNHLNPDDLDIVLIGPTGKRLLLLSDAGGTTDVVSANVTFDDAAAAGVPDAGPLVSATVRPTNFGTADTIPDLPFPAVNTATAGSATLASTFNGTNPNGTWSLYVVDDATTSAGNIMGGWSIDITAGGTGGAKRFTAADFDGDGLTDASVFRPTDGNWYYRESPASSNRVFPAFGTTGDFLVPADYDGDNKTDVAVFRPTQGRWYIVQSTTSTLVQVAWGTNGDRPVPADFDADGKSDVAVWRSGVWYVLQSGTGTGRVVSWGTAGDQPLRGHFEGTNGADFAVYRVAENNWYILNNAGSSSRVVNFGAAGDVAVPADYDGDGMTDIAIFRGPSGDWSILRSSTGLPSGIHWGVSGDIPVPGDYDGDSRADVTVWRPSTGSWYEVTSSFVSFKADNWGQSGDIPIPQTYGP